jgi:hypothetical protein
MHPTIERAFGLLPESERTKMRRDLIPFAQSMARKKKISLSEALERLIEEHVGEMLGKLGVNHDRRHELDLSHMVWTSCEGGQYHTFIFGQDYSGDVHGRFAITGIAVVDGRPVKCWVRFISHPFWQYGSTV